MGRSISTNHRTKITKELKQISKSANELLKMIHKPGWTTPIEYLMAHGTCRGISIQLQSLEKASQQMINRK